MNRARRSPLRFLAPLGLVAFVIAFIVVVGTAGNSNGGDSNSGGDKAEQRDLKGGDNNRGERRREKREDRLPDDMYIVKEGDTLASISQKTGIPVEDLQEFNPELDPQALVTGQCVWLKETNRPCTGESGTNSGSPQ